MRHQDELLDSLRELLFKLHSGIRSKLKVRRGDKLIKNHGKQNEKGFCLRLCKILQKMVWFFFFGHFINEYYGYTMVIFNLGANIFLLLFRVNFSSPCRKVYVYTLNQCFDTSLKLYCW